MRCGSVYASSGSDDRQPFRAGYFRLRRGAGRQRADHQPGPCRGADGLRISNHGKSSRRALLRHERSGMLEIIECEWGCALPASYAERVGAMIEAGFRESLAPIEGVAEALDSLTLPVCVASSSSL